MKILSIIALTILIFCSLAPINPTADEIVKKANNLQYGESSVGNMSMTIVRPKWSRTVEMKIWTKGNEYSMVLITAPAKEKGQVFLKRKNEMWNWIPSISRMVKMPPSMLSQGWLGSDFTNDDMLNESSIVKDYKHILKSMDKIENQECYKIECLPNSNSNVIWGKVILWISKEDYFILKTESYDEDMVLVKTETASEFKKLDDRVLPTKFTIIPANQPGNKTIVETKQMDFNKALDDNFFSQQNMKNIK